MTMPADTPAWLRQALEDLARAQIRSEDRFAAVETQLATLTTQISRLATVDERTMAPLAQLKDGQASIATRLNRHGDQLCTLTGWAWEARGRDHATNFLSDLAQRMRVLTPSQLDALLDPAVQDGRLVEDEAEQLRLADLVCSGRARATGEEVRLVVEVSARLGQLAMPVVIGERIDRDAQAVAKQANARQIIVTDEADRGTSA